MKRHEYGTIVLAECGFEAKHLTKCPKVTGGESDMSMSWFSRAWKTSFPKLELPSEAFRRNAFERQFRRVRLIAPAMRQAGLGLRLPPAGQLIVLAGKRWLVQEIDAMSKTVWVSPAGGKVPVFVGNGGELHKRVVQEMKTSARSFGEGLGGCGGNKRRGCSLLRFEG